MDACTRGRPLAPPLAFLFAAGCSFAGTGERWDEQLVPAGPCYEANLLDGLDTTSTGEAHAVFACLNATGALDAYAPLDEALDGETREAVIGIVLAQWLAELPTADVSLGGLVRDGIALLEDPSGLYDTLHLGFELVYGRPWTWLGAAVPLNSQAALDDGLLVPGMAAGSAAATALLDEDLAPLETIGATLRSDTTRSALWTLASIGASAHPTLLSLADTWAADLADALERTQDGANDRWSGASGNSLRDLAVLLTSYETDGRMTLEHVADPLAPLLDDTRLRDSLARVLADEVDAGRVDALPAQVLYLASVDPLGGALSTGEDSALVALLRLLHDGNTEVDCSIDLVFFDVDISLGNLSVELLQLLARQDPGTVDSGVGLLGDLLGVALTDDILDAVADSGVCPAIDDALIADLHAIDRLADPEADELLLVLLDVLTAFDDLGEVPALVDTIGAVHAQGVVAPLEEVIRDVGDTALAADLVDVLPALLDPLAYHDAAYFPAGVVPLDFEMVWDAAAATISEADGESPLAALAGPLKALLAQDETWVLLTRVGALAAEPDAEIADLLLRVGELCAEDPDLTLLDDLADTATDRALMRPLLLVVEADAGREALGRTELTREGPVPFTAKLVHGGTLTILLDTLELLATLIPEEGT
jgi:hypothetical protein